MKNGSGQKNLFLKYNTLSEKRLEKSIETEIAILHHAQKPLGMCVQTELCKEYHRTLGNKFWFTATLHIAHSVY